MNALTPRTIRGRGRGSNSRSLANLHPPAKDSFVMNYGTDGVWRALDGPMTHAKALRWAARLEKLNSTDKQQFIAQRGTPQ